jgi:hypothetical protein
MINSFLTIFLRKHWYIYSIRSLNRGRMRALKTENNMMGGAEKPYFCASFDEVALTGYAF